MSASREKGPRGLRMRGHLMRAMSKLDRWTFALGLVVCAVGGLIGLIAALSVNGVPFQNRFDLKVVVPGDTPPLKAGDQVRVAGKVAGIVTGVEPERDEVLVEAEVDPDFTPIGENASVHVGVLVGTSLAFLVLDPGDTSNPIEEGATIPARRVTLSSSLPQALEVFDDETRAALARDFEVLGEGALGRGAQTNEALKDFRAVGAHGVPLIDALTPKPGALGRAVRGARDLTRGLRGTRPDDNAAGTRAAGAVLTTLGERAATSGDLIERLADVQDELLSTLPVANRALGRTAILFRRLLPGARSIRSQLPDFVGLFQEGPELSAGTREFGEAARPALRSLARTIPLLEEPAAALPEAVPPLSAVTEGFDAYRAELLRFAAGLSGALDYEFLGAPAVRISGSLFCHNARNPDPPPGRVAEDRQAC